MLIALKEVPTFRKEIFPIFKKLLKAYHTYQLNGSYVCTIPTRCEGKRGIKDLGTSPYVPRKCLPCSPGCPHGTDGNVFMPLVFRNIDCGPVMLFYPHSDFLGLGVHCLFHSAKASETFFVLLGQSIHVFVFLQIFSYN